MEYPASRSSMRSPSRLSDVEGMSMPSTAGSMYGGDGYRRRDEQAGVLLPSVAAVAVAEEATAQARARQPGPSPLPFTNTRLRTYTQRVDQLADLTGLEGANAPEDGFVPDYVPLAARVAVHGARALAGSAGEQNPAAVAAAMTELQQIREEISRLESHVNTLKTAGKHTTALGRTVAQAVGKPARKTAPRPDHFAVRKREWQRDRLLAHSTLPVSRHEAVVLDDTLEQLLPAGLVTASLQVGGAGGAHGMDVGLFEKQYELVDMVLREAARQVAAGCHERGAVIDKLRQRYSEFFGCLKEVLFRLQKSYSAARWDVDALSGELKTLSEERNLLRRNLQEAKTEVSELRVAKAELESSLKTHVEQSDAALVALQSDKKMLQVELAHYEQRLGEGTALRETAVVSAISGLEEQLATIIDERDDLLNRVRFLERQLVKSREERARNVVIDHVGSQTEAVHTGIPSGTDTSGRGHLGDAPSTAANVRGSSRRTNQPMPFSTSLAPAKPSSAGAALGAFSGMLMTERVGRIKPCVQIVKIVGQIYAEKVEADLVDDRERTPRMGLPEFVYDWHLNRYGLRRLADANLLDLITSVRHWAGGNLKLKLFAQLCGLMPSPYGDDTREPLHFYLHCMRVITANVMLQFPDADDVVFWLKPLRVLDVVRLVFPAFATVEAATELREFMTFHVEPLMDLKAKMYDSDRVLQMLLEEWQRRTERNSAGLRALFRAGDGDVDGLLTYDEFLSVVRHADAQRAERQILRMYREALHLSPDGETVGVEAFVTVARKHGLAAWQMNYGASDAAEAVPAQAGPEHDAALFLLLDGALDASEDLMEQIESVRDKLGESHPTTLHVVRQFELFKRMFEAHDDADGTWLAYRVLTGEIRAAMMRYRGGLRNAVAGTSAKPTVRTTHSTYTSPLVAMMQQTSDEVGHTEGGIGRTSPTAAGAPELAENALNMLRGSTSAVEHM